MDERELKAITKRLDAMSARADAVIAKEKLGKRMPILNFKPRKINPPINTPENTPENTPVRDIPADIPRSRGRYRANEARLWDMEGRQWPSQAERCGCPRQTEPSIMDDIFAGFEAEFDAMMGK